MINPEAFKFFLLLSVVGLVFVLMSRTGRRHYGKKRWGEVIDGDRMDYVGSRGDNDFRFQRELEAFLGYRFQTYHCVLTPMINGGLEVEIMTLYPPLPETRDFVAQQLRNCGGVTQVLFSELTWAQVFKPTKIEWRPLRATRR